MITNIMLLREILIKLYKKLDIYVKILFKFLFALIVFTQINATLGYSEVFKRGSVVFLLSLISVLLPELWFVLLVGIAVCLNAFIASLELGIVTAIVVLVAFLMYARMNPRRGYLLIAIPLLLNMNLLPIVPIVLGLVATPLAALVGVVGIALFYFIGEMNALAIYKHVELTDIPNVLIDIYKQLVENFVGNKEMVVQITVFIVVTVLVFIVSRFKVKYIHYIAIATGAVANLAVTLIGNTLMNVDTNAVSLILFSLLAALIASVIQFMRLNIDYHRVENVQFEDDDYYYYVKAVPKIKIAMPNRKIKRINLTKEKETVSATETFEDELTEEKTIRKYSWSKDSTEANPQTATAEPLFENSVGSVDMQGQETNQTGQYFEEGNVETEKVVPTADEYVDLDKE